VFSPYSDLVCDFVDFWKERNNRIFQSKASNAAKLIDNVKLLSFWSLKANSKNTAFDYHRWWLSPFSCLDIG
jgi:hypothetical protein